MTLYQSTLTLVLVMDPLGNIPVFLSILSRFDTRAQKRIMIREVIIAFLVLTIFLFAGRYILHGLHITTEALSIAGGIILFLIALRMIFPSDKRMLPDEEFDEPLIVPLAIPLTAGPSALATVMLIAAQAPHHLSDSFIAIIIATAIFLFFILGSRTLMKYMGKRGLIAVERLMGMILTTVSVQMFLSGVVSYIKIAST